MIYPKDQYCYLEPTSQGKVQLRRCADNTMLAELSDNSKEHQGTTERILELVERAHHDGRFRGLQDAADLLQSVAGEVGHGTENTDS